MLCRVLIVAFSPIAAADAQTLTIATYNIENYCPANRMTSEAGFAPGLSEA